MSWDVMQSPDFFKEQSRLRNDQFFQNELKALAEKVFSTGRQRKKTIFISYGHPFSPEECPHELKDVKEEWTATFVKDLAHDLELLGFDIIVDTETLGLGRHLVSAMQKSAREADHVFLMVSETYLFKTKHRPLGGCALELAAVLERINNMSSAEQESTRYVCPLILQQKKVEGFPIVEGVGGFAGLYLHKMSYIDVIGDIAHKLYELYARSDIDFEKHKRLLKQHVSPAKVIAKTSPIFGGNYAPNSIVPDMNNTKRNTGSAPVTRFYSLPENPQKALEKFREAFKQKDADYITAYMQKYGRHVLRDEILFKYSYSRSIELLEFALELGFDITKGDDTHDWNVLHWSAYLGYLDVFRYVWEKYPGMRTLLTGKTGAVNGYENAIICAVRGEQTAVCKFILEQNVLDVNQSAARMKTALHWALEKKSIECGLLLMLFGANHTLKDENGRTPFDLDEKHALDDEKRRNREMITKFRDIASMSSGEKRKAIETALAEIANQSGSICSLS